MYIVQAKSGEGAEQACTYDASYHPSSLIRCLPFRHLQTCTPQPPLPTTPAQASVDEKSGEVSRLQDRVGQLQALSSDPAVEIHHQGAQEENDRDEKGQPAQ